MKKNDYIAIRLLLLGLLGIFSIPFIVTQTSWLNFCNTDFGKPNEIGDMIGGTTGPFIALVSAAIVYLKLREQIEMNNEFKKRFEKEDYQKEENYAYNLFLDNLKEAKKNIEALEFLDSDLVKYKGIEGIKKMKTNLSMLLKRTVDFKRALGSDYMVWEREFVDTLHSYLSILDRINIYSKTSFTKISDKYMLATLSYELEYFRFQFISSIPKLILEYISEPNCKVGISFIKNRQDLLVHYVEYNITHTEMLLTRKAYDADINRHGTSFSEIYAELPEIRKILEEEFKLNLN